MDTNVGNGDRNEAEETPRRDWPLPEGARRINPDEERDPVEEASNESFPASDPPSFTPDQAG